MPSIGERLKHGWNAFKNNKDITSYSYGTSSSYRPDRVRLSRGNERSIITAIYNRIAVDAAAIDIHHVRLDENKRYLETMDSSLDSALNLEANVDQTGRDLRQDLFMSLFDEGVVAVVPVDAEINPKSENLYDIYSLRTGRITQWMPNDIRVSLYNEQTGRHEEITVAKKMTAIIQNPFYSVMNEPNSTYQRLVRKLNILDAIDEQSGSGKLDLIIQLPYTVRTETKQKQADERRKKIEEQLMGSKYGIAYIDATEKVTQLNRSVENNLMKQIEYLTNMLYGQLGITAEIINGTADEQTMLNYNNRTIEPLLSAVTDEMKRKFLTKTGRTQGQSIMFFRDPLRLIATSTLAELADKLTRNEICSSNEIRQAMGLKPAQDPRADELRNKNLNQEADAPDPVNVGPESDTSEDDYLNFPVSRL